MFRRKNLPCYFPWLLLVFARFSTAAQPGVDHAEVFITFEPGDRIAVRRSTKTTGIQHGRLGADSATTAAPNAAPEGPVPRWDETVVEWEDQILQVDPNGWPAQISRRMQRWRFLPSGSSDGERIEPLEGATVTVVEAKPVPHVSSTHESAPSKLGRALELQLPRFLSQIPRAALRVGQSWPIEPEPIIDALRVERAETLWDAPPEVQHAKGTGMLLALSQGPDRIATLRFDIDVTAMKDGVQRDLKRQLTLSVGLQNRRLLSMEQETSSAVAGSPAEKEAVVQQAGTLEVRERTTFRWRNVQDAPLDDASKDQRGKDRKLATDARATGGPKASGGAAGNPLLLGLRGASMGIAGGKPKPRRVGGASRGAGSGGGNALGGRDETSGRTQPGKIIQRGPVSREVVQRVVGRVMDQIKPCYARARAQAPDLAGKIVVAWQIAENGSVAATRTVKNTFPDETVAGCLLDILQKQQFPRASDGGAVWVTHAFAFSSSP